ncbi:MAG: hypothetical protein MI794_05855 [Pseudomonadales bacterium]|nr:hypothetical protein [Pseudomonadales bacterium]
MSLARMLLAAIGLGLFLSVILMTYGWWYEQRISETKPSCPKAVDAAHHEALSTYRHYSNLRFLMLPVFASLTGALLKTVFGDYGLISGPLIEYVPTVGVWLTLAFLSLEIALDIIMTRTALFINHVAPYQSMQRDYFTTVVQACTRFPIFTLFAVAIWLWLKIADSQGIGAAETFFRHEKQTRSPCSATCHLGINRTP